VPQTEGVTQTPWPETPREATELVVPAHEPATLPVPEAEQPRPSQPIRKAIDEVHQVIASLKTVLAAMEEVIELLEMAEVQKEVDEGEIAALRQALKQLQRGRESRPSSGESQSPRSRHEPPQ
jgi:hypothetical protein